ncbi:MAG: EFR1 family ferrodoxin [Oscillospiraceae bacterium]|nr:EFR1 family ferrodoxin [Oscillospiraceae bacterium]
MSENIIYCYSGAGHCLDMAKSIAKILGDTDIVLMRSYPAKTDARDAKRVGFIFSCMAGGLPGDMESYIRDIQIAPDAYIFAVEQYAGYLGCGLRKIDEIVDLDYWDAVSNHSTAIWLMPHTLTVPPTTPEKAQKRIDTKAAVVAAAVLQGKQSVKRPPKAAAFELMSKGLGKTHAKRSEKFEASDSCIACGTCVQICPRGNIKLEGKKPVFGTNCIGCLSCVQYCPKQAINIGSITEKRERFPNPRVKASELTEKIIHID